VSEPSKNILGTHSPTDDDEGAQLAQSAIQKAKEKGRLNEAADIMEEAFNKSPSLRDKYAYQVRLWRRGISM
jgi:serine/threonine-protein kinase